MKLANAASESRQTRQDTSTTPRVQCFQFRRKTKRCRLNLPGAQGGWSIRRYPAYVLAFVHDAAVFPLLAVVAGGFFMSGARLDPGGVQRCVAGGRRSPQMGKELAPSALA
jgi:hypothetical protein